MFIPKILQKFIRTLPNPTIRSLGLSQPLLYKENQNPGGGPIRPLLCGNVGSKSSETMLSLISYHGYNRNIQFFDFISEPLSWYAKEAGLESVIGGQSLLIKTEYSILPRVVAINIVSNPDWIWELLAKRSHIQVNSKKLEVMRYDGKLLNELQGS